MEIEQYTLLTGRVTDRRAETNGRTPHYQILIDTGLELFRVAVNTRSGANHRSKSDLLYFADDDFRHQITTRLANVDDGPHSIPTPAGGLALDYQRGGMFDRRHMRRVPSSRPGPSNDLIDELDHWVARAHSDPAMRLHAYGARWGPEMQANDQVFGFKPGNGIHDVHMNQGNWDEHRRENHPWTDGGLIFHDAQDNRWCAIFLAFQTQSWHTDEEGNPLPYRNVHPRHEQLDEAEDRPLTRISGAFVHPNELKAGVEHVSIWNESHEPLDVAGWTLQNRARNAVVLAGDIPPRRSRRFPLPTTVPLSTRGGLIRLLDGDGVEVDGVSYTRQEARRKHGVLRF